jgi:hypothetical protein
MRQMSPAAFLCSGGTAYERASAEFLYLDFVMISRAGARIAFRHIEFELNILAVEELAR